MRVLILFLVFISPLLTHTRAQTGARLLIITHDDYYNALKPLAEWKHQIGLKAKLIRLSEIGSDTNQIRSFIVDAYNSWPIRPEYVLLVGNHYQIGWFQFDYQGQISYSDNYYTNVSGDFHNEVIPGRIWVDDSFQAKTVVAKILGYEKNPWLNDSLWLRKGMTIVCEDTDPFPADSVYWSDARYLYHFMQNAGYYQIDSLSRLRGHNHYNVLNGINNGRAYILYRGVGAVRWSPPFYYIDTTGMFNGFKLPIVISGTCATIDGIGHEWLKAGSPTNPRGSVGFCGTTTLLEHAAEMRSALVCGTSAAIFCDSLATLGSAVENGRLKYVELFGNSLEYNSWGCIGDPSMRLWTSTPGQINVNYNGELHPGICSLIVNVKLNMIPYDYALACISSKKDSSIYDYGYTNNGSIVLSDTFSNPGDSVFLTVTGRNVVPFQKAFRICQNNGAYIALNSYMLNDSINGNNDRVANPGENIELTFCLENIGDTTAYEVNSIIQALQADSFFLLDDTIKYFGDIFPGDTVNTGIDGFNIQISPECPDRHICLLQLVSSDSAGSSWHHNIEIQVHRPILEIAHYFFPGNHKYTPIGDTNFLYLSLLNSGSYPAENIYSRIINADSGIIIIDSMASFDPIMPCSIGTNLDNPFVIAVDTSFQSCTQLGITVEVNTDYSCDTCYLIFYAGQYDYLIWDKDPDHSTGPTINAILDSLRFNGLITDGDLIIENLSVHKCLFVCLGVFPNKYRIANTDPVGPAIVNYIENQNGKVYMEGGDVFYSDPYTAYGYFFNPTFKLFGLAHHVSFLSRLNGQPNCFTYGMSFRHSPITNSNDRLGNQGNTQLLFTNADNSQGIAVASFNRTIGSSFEIGSLIDSIPPSTKRCLVDSIMAYFHITPTGISEELGTLQRPETDLVVFPNPSRKNINISLQLTSKTNEIKLQIYDISGRLVWDANPSTELKNISIRWNCVDKNGRPVCAGVYFVRLNTKDFNICKKVIFLD